MTDPDVVDLQLRLRALEERVAALEGTPVPASPAGDPEIQQLLLQGNKIGAIKRYRELTGAGLAEAKDAIDRLT